MSGVTRVTGAAGVGLAGGVGGDCCATATAKGIIATTARIIERCFIAVSSEVRSVGDCIHQSRHDVFVQHGLA